MQSRLKDEVYALWRRILPSLGAPSAALQRINFPGWSRAIVTPVPVAVACVYRQRNAAHVSMLMRQLPDARFALHALDHVDASLAPWTVSTGPGKRMPLLNGLIEALGPREDEYVAIADDDVTFVGNPRKTSFVGLGATAGLDIFQPAHAHGSYATFSITRYEPLSIARRTRFVESGPLTVFSPRVRSRVIPFSSRFEMGWGADVAWSRLADEGFRLGVVDSTPMMHHQKVGTSYDNHTEAAIEARESAAAGVSNAHGLATNVGLTWRPWQRSPKWLGQVSSESAE